MKITGIFAALFFILSCAGKNGCKEYMSIKNSQLKGAELLRTLSEFEVNHSGNFESKVDLGSYYLLQNDIEKAEEYFKRARSVIKNSCGGKEGRQAEAILYGSMAYIHFVRREFEDAIKDIGIAVQKDYKKENGYEYLKAQILDASGKKDEALALFESTYKSVPQKISAECIDAMVHLYAQKERWDEALRFLELYYEKGYYYADFGAFASVIYEKNGAWGAGILAAFLDVKYYNEKYDTGMGTFKNDMRKIETLLKEKNCFEEAKDDYFFVCNFDKANVEYESVQDESVQDGASFIRDFLILDKKIKLNLYTLEDAQAYLNYEPFFKYSPGYYMNAWKALVTLTPWKRGEYIGALEKIIALGCTGQLDSAARTLIGYQVSIRDADVLALLMPFEVEAIVNEWRQTHNGQKMERVYAALELPDNTYLFKTMMLLKEYCTHSDFRALMEERKSSAAGRLKERINFILQ